MKTYTDKEVKELLSRQRIICAQLYYDKEVNEEPEQSYNTIRYAPEPQYEHYGTLIQSHQKFDGNPHVQPFDLNVLKQNHGDELPKWWEKIAQQNLIKINKKIKDFNLSLNEDIHIEPVFDEKGEFVGQLIDYKK